jgi:hypothetical protein
MIRGLDENDDWIFGNGIQAYKVGNAAIAQNIKTRLREWVGDCFFNIEAGIDWYNRMDIGQQELLVLDIRLIILKTAQVIALEEFNFKIVDRTLTIDFIVSTIFSEALQETLSFVIE